MIPNFVSLPGFPRLSPSVNFSTRYKGIGVKIVNWKVFGVDTDRVNWNYYLTIPERNTPPEIFAKIWLDDIVKEGFAGRPWLSHDYYGVPLFDSLEMHGGVTFYAKHGHTVGFRSVEIGCDYHHSWDMERDNYELEEVVRDAFNSADQALSLFCISENGFAPRAALPAPAGE